MVLFEQTDVVYGYKVGHIILLSVNIADYSKSLSPQVSTYFLCPRWSAAAQVVVKDKSKIRNGQ